jgi:hypothetical protein
VASVGNPTAALGGWCNFKRFGPEADLANICCIYHDSSCFTDPFDSGFTAGHFKRFGLAAERYSAPHNLFTRTVTIALIHLWTLLCTVYFRHAGRNYAAIQ